MVVTICVGIFMLPPPAKSSLTCSCFPLQASARSSDGQQMSEGIPAAQESGSAAFAKIGDRKLYLLNLSVGIGAYHRDHHDLTGTLGLGLDLSYVRGPHFFSIRWASASFMDGGGYDFSLLYGRDWTVHRLLFSAASGLGYSMWDTPGEHYSCFGLPVDLKALILSSERGGVSLGIHVFAFLASSYQYFGVCLDLGIFAAGH
jgi:hypothetical protein